MKFESSSTGETKWIVRTRSSREPRVRLFCLPHAGGAANVYRRWHSHFPAEIQVCAIELPGRATRWSEPAIDHAHELAETTAEALMPHLDRPYAIFGHSMGALLAFEVARALRRKAQREPFLLIASGRGAPQCDPSEPRIAHLPEREFIERLQARYQAIPREVLAEPELLRFVVPLLRADLTLIETYAWTADTPLTCRIAAFGGTFDALVPQASLSAWREQTQGSFGVRMFPTGHFFNGAAEDLVMRAVEEEIGHSFEPEL